MMLATIRGATGLVVFALAVGCTCVAARADAAAPGVARVSVIASGTVVVQRGDSAKQVAATVNAPLLPGDFISTSQDGRAEVQLDGYSVLRLDGGVQARIAHNGRASRQVQLAAGTIELTILHSGDGSTRIDTPSISLEASHPGDYRIAVEPDGSTQATARTGRAQLVAPHQTYDLLPGKTLVARGAATAPVVSSIAEIAHDAFDDFSAQRDRKLYAALRTDTSIPPGIAGYDDLGAYGRWVTVAPYGTVWAPSVGASWAPYRDGQWSWEDGYGWTWVASEPWGWTPYHYGRWFYSNDYGWCWYPPILGVYPVWQPALVGFFGFGLSMSYAGWGWVPLGPFEPFYAWYPGWPYLYAWNGWNNGGGNSFPPPPPHRGPGPRHHPIVKTGPIVGIYRNIRVGGATQVSAKAWRAGDFAHAIPVDVHRLGQVTLIRGALPIDPTVANLRYSPTAPKHLVRIASAFAQPRFAIGPPHLPALHATALAGSWQRFNRSRGTTIAAPREPVYVKGSLPVHVAYPSPLHLSHFEPEHEAYPAPPTQTGSLSHASAPATPSVPRSSGSQGSRRTSGALHPKPPSA